jgi:hypothetical protein
MEAKKKGLYPQIGMLVTVVKLVSNEMVMSGHG